MTQEDKQTEALMELVSYAKADIANGYKYTPEEALTKLKLSREDGIAVVDALESNEAKFNEKFIDAAKKHKEVVL